MVAVTAGDVGRGTRAFHRQTPNFVRIRFGFRDMEGTMDNEKVYLMDFSKVYHLLVNKAERKGRTRQEVDEVICWLTGYSQAELEGMLGHLVLYGDFFRNAPSLNENRKLIRGMVCGVRVEEVEEPLMQEIRYLDKLIDELARGKAMNRILRGES